MYVCRPYGSRHCAGMYVVGLMGAGIVQVLVWHNHVPLAYPSYCFLLAYLPFVPPPPHAGQLAEGLQCDHEGCQARWSDEGLPTGLQRVSPARKATVEG